MHFAMKVRQRKRRKLKQMVWNVLLQNLTLQEVERQKAVVSGMLIGLEASFTRMGWAQLSSHGVTQISEKRYRRGIKEIFRTYTTLFYLFSLLFIFLPKTSSSYT
jgi:hypothetical protein